MARGKFKLQSRKLEDQFTPRTFTPTFEVILVECTTHSETHSSHLTIYFAFALLFLSLLALGLAGDATGVVVVEVVAAVAAPLPLPVVFLLAAAFLPLLGSFAVTSMATVALATSSTVALANFSAPPPPSCLVAAPGPGTLPSACIESDPAAASSQKPRNL